ncbi:pH-response regulator protein palA/rim20, partial [Bonamia ostreae]
MLKAASIYAFLVNETAEIPLKQRSMDMRQTALCFAALVAQAQAQTCFFEKAQADKFSIELISKLAMSVADLYKKAENNLEKDSALKEWIKKSDYPFHRHIESQKFLFQATACFWASKAALYSKKYGEEISWLKLSEENIDKAENIKKKGLHKNIERSRGELSELIAKELDRATDDNNSIYHYRVPNKKELVMPEPKLLAIMKKFRLEDLIKPEDRAHLDKLVPVSVAKVCKEVRNTLLSELELLASESNAQNERHSLVLGDFSAFFNSANGRKEMSDRFPNLLNDINSMKRHGGSRSIKMALENLGKSHLALKEKYGQIMLLLKSAKERHEFNVAKFGGYWNLPSPEQLAKNYFGEAETINKYLDDAYSSNQKMEKRYKDLEESLNFIESQSEEAILKTLPNIKSEFGDLPVIGEIRELCSVLEKCVNDKNEFIKN